MVLGSIGKRLAVAGLAAVVALGFGVSGASAAGGTVKVGDAAKVTVGVQESTINGQPVYVVKTTNIGNGPARSATLTVPYDANALRVTGVDLSRPDAWVSENTAGELKVDTGKLGSGGDAVTATVHFVRLPGYADAELTTPVKLVWADDRGGGTASSNQPSADGTMLQVMPSDTGMILNGSGFAAGEPVVIWYNAPDGSTLATRIKRNVLYDASYVEARHKDNQSYDEGSTYTVADDQGRILLNLATNGLPLGAYSLVAQGHSTGATTATPFRLQ